MGPIQRSFERYQRRPPTASSSPGSQPPKLQSLLYQEGVNVRTSNFVRTFIGSIGTKTH